MPSQSDKHTADKPARPLAETLNFSMLKTTDTGNFLGRFVLGLIVTVVAIIVASKVIKSQILTMVIIWLYWLSAVLWSRKATKEKPIHEANRHAQLEAFATANGLGYKNEPNYTSSGVIFTVGSEHTSEDMLSGKLRGYHFRMYGHMFHTGRGRDKMPFYYAVIEITLPKKVPQIFLDYRHEEYLIADPLVTFARDHLVKLEGNFSETYKVYFDRRYASTALTLLNPLFMEKLLAARTNCEIEFVEDRVFLYSANNYFPIQQNLKELFRILDFMVTEMERQMDTFTFDPKDVRKGVMPAGKPLITPMPELPGLKW
jgi:hypothetical protein